MKKNYLREEKEHKNDGNFIRIEPADVICKNDIIWILPENINGIFYMNRKEEGLKIFSRFPKHLYNGPRTYISIEKIDDKIYCIPFYGTKVVIIDTKKNSFVDIGLDDSKLGCKFGDPLFIGGVQYENYLVAIPYKSKAIVCLDLVSYEVEYITGWSARIGQVAANANGYFRKQYGLVEGKLYFPTYNANAVMEVDCMNWKTKIYQLGRGDGYSGICREKESFWLTRNNGELVSWNPSEGCKMILDMKWDKQKSIPHAFVGGLYYDGNLHIFPRIQMEQIAVNEKRDLVVEEGEYSIVKEDDNYLVHYRWDTKNLTIVNKSDNCMSKVAVWADSRIVLRLIFEANGNTLAESKDVNIRHFLREYEGRITDEIYIGERDE